MASDGTTVDHSVLDLAGILAPHNLEVTFVTPGLVPATGFSRAARRSGESDHELATSQYGVPFSVPNPMILIACPPSIGDVSLGW